MTRDLAERRTLIPVLRGLDTGADEAFLTKDPRLVEPGLLVPMAMPEDTDPAFGPGVFHWGGTYLINPWDGAGRLVHRKNHPRLRAHLEQHRAALTGRAYVDGGRAWYRTAEVVRDEIIGRPKLIIDTRDGRLNPVLDLAGHYPHRDLRFVMSEDWELDVLGGLLLAEPDRLTGEGVEAPDPTELPDSLCRQLRIALGTGDPAVAAAAVRRAGL